MCERGGRRNRREEGQEGRRAEGEQEKHGARAGKSQSACSTSEGLDLTSMAGDYVLSQLTLVSGVLLLLGFDAWQRIRRTVVQAVEDLAGKHDKDEGRRIRT